MRARVVIVLTVGALVAMASVSPVARARSGQPQRSPATQSAAPVGHGIDLAGMDKSVAPGDDFFRFANGRWLKRTEIPPDRSSYAVFSVLAEATAVQTRQLLEQAAAGRAAAGSDERKIGDYYASYMDEAGIEAKGLAPLKPFLQQIAAIADRRVLAEWLGRDLRADVDPLNATNFHTHRLFGAWIAADINEPTRYAPYLLQGGLGMPDREYYLATSPRMELVRTAYRQHIATVLKLAGIADATAKAGRVFDLERRIAQVHWSRDQSLDVLKANNPWKRTEFATKAPGLDWEPFFAAAKLGSATQVIVWQPSAIIGIAKLVGSEPLDAWRDYLTYQFVDEATGLPNAFVEERFAFYGKVLSGTPQLRDRWKRAIDATNGALADAVGKAYVQRHFPPEAKARVQAMVGDIVAAFGRRIDSLTWMAPNTKAGAKAKLSTLIVGLGYPDKWRDYGGLQVVRGEAFMNAYRAELFDYDWNVAKLGRPVDRTEWVMTPQTVNAVNLPVLNALNFPAAILQPPFFDPAADPAANFGSIGAVIGHEISHSFDDQGSQFDAKGRLANWWTPDDFAHFKAASARLVAQYNAYQPFPDMHVNGELTLSENIADVAGLSAAYDGYRQSLNGAVAKGEGGFTGDQVFFIAFGQSWRDKTREPALRQQLVTDGHAPDEYRAQTVRNIDAWYN
ncbi:MAG: M13 family metallopeptidase, partial [Bacteroidales bacterium]